MPNKQEQILQQSINQYCNIKHIPFYCINNNVVPPVINGIYNREFAIRQAVKNKSMGLKKGVADGFIIANKNTIFIEFKVDKGKQSTEQKEFQVICENNNTLYFVIRNLEEFIDLIDSIKIMGR